MNNLIGISGKAGSGKDTVGKIIEAFTTKVNMNGVVGQLGKDMLLDSNLCKDVLIERCLWYGSSDYKIKKYADKLKDIVCLLTGCTRADLENREFKESKLSVDWDDSHGIDTYRDLIQVLGTECGRDIIHPNIWVNALFADYEGKEDKSKRKYEHIANYKNVIYPSWLVTDVRFPNELKAIEDRGGIVIRVDRANDQTGLTSSHESEKALDKHDFKYHIQNDGSIEELVEKVKEIIQ